MTGREFISVLPPVLLAASALTGMIVVAFYRRHALIWLWTLAGFAAAAASLPAVSHSGAPQVTALLHVDSYTVFFTALILAAAFAATVFSYPYLRRRTGQHEEFYLLLLLATMGSVVLVGSSHFASLFLGLEILSASLFTLTAYPLGRLNLEAGIKYLVLAAVSAAFLLFGMALVYADLGTLEFSRMAESAGGAGGSVLFTAGLGMMVVGFGFKLALVPFHMWTPDVYQGAPAPVTAYVATVSKVAVFALMLRFFLQVGIQSHAHLFYLFTALAAASMIAGNLLALLSDSIKRILAYSSIAHMGYLMVAFLASGPLAVTAAAFYLVAYAATSMGAFGVVSLMSSRGREADSLDDYQGLFWRRPWLAGILSAMLLSLAGIPPTAGLIGKFYLLDAGVGSSLWLLVFFLVAGSVIGLYYYLRIILVMYQRTWVKEVKAASGRFQPGDLVLAALLAVIIWLGVYPAPLIEVIQRAVALN